MAVNNALNANSKGIQYFDGTSAFSGLVQTDAQLLIGRTNNSPTAATLTQGAGILITNASGSITIASAATSNTNPVILRSGTIDITNTGVQALVTTSGSFKFVPIRVVTIVIVATAVSLGPSLNIGTNAANYDNIVSNAQFAGAMNATDLVRSDPSLFISTTPHAIIQASTTINVNVTVGLTGTQLTVQFLIEGIYI
jgi:hypothetical protein